MTEYRCENCGAARPNADAGAYALFDYCARCGRNLCDGCMESGCCGASPAESGAEADDADAPMPRAT